MVKARLGDAGMIATDLLPALPLVIKQLKDLHYSFRRPEDICLEVKEYFDE